MSRGRGLDSLLIPGHSHCARYSPIHHPAPIRCYISFNMISYTTLLAVAATLPSSCAIEIKLNQGHTLDEAKKLYPDAQTSPLFTLPRTRLIELSSVEKGLPDLTLWYSFDPSDASLTAQTEEHIVTSLKQLKSIDYVEIPKGAMPSRRLAVTPNFVPNQGYLKMNSPTNNGIDAEYSWTFDGGNGEGVTIYDVGKVSSHSNN